MRSLGGDYLKFNKEGGKTKDIWTWIRPKQRGESGGLNWEH